MATPEDLLFQDPNRIGGSLLSQVVGAQAAAQPVGPPAPVQPVGPPAPGALAAVANGAGPESAGAALTQAPVDQPETQAGRRQSAFESVANRITKASISFLTQTPQIELDRLALQNTEIELQAQALKDDATQRAAENFKQEQLTKLAEIFTDPNSTQTMVNRAARQMNALDPVFGKQAREGANLQNEAGVARTQARLRRVNSFGEDIEAQKMEVVRQAVQLRADGFIEKADESLKMAAEDDADFRQSLGALNAEFLSPEEVEGATAETLTAAARAEVGGFTEEEIRGQALVEAGLQARAGISAQERIATDEDLAEQVIDFETKLRERGKFSELTGASRAKAIDTGFETIEKIDINIRNLDKAIAALDAGAQTGAIVNRFTPTVREQTIILRQVQASLGLDVVQSVTFGALSEGELNLALATALPINLDEPALRQWILDRQAAQTKLRGYLSEQIEFLEGGGTKAGFLRKKRRQQQGQPDTAPGAAPAAGGGQPFDATGFDLSSGVTAEDLGNMPPADRELFRIQ